MRLISSLVKASAFLYSCLLAMYPPSFRKRFGDEMRLVFRDMCQSAIRDRGAIGLAKVWRLTLVDLPKSAVAERWAVLDKWAALLLLVGIADGLFAAYVDYHNDEVQAPVLVILVCTCLLGLIRPKGAWKWALAVGLGVPACHIGGRWLGYAGPYPVKPNDYASIIALIPAFIGSYFGALMRVAAYLPGDQIDRRGDGR
jgi:hypothetical protein